MFGNTVETRIFRKADDNVLAILSTAVSQTARMPGASVAGPGSTIPATTTTPKTARLPLPHWRALAFCLATDFRLRRLKWHRPAAASRP